jgi:hypothetical protein
MFPNGLPAEIRSHAPADKLADLEQLAGKAGQAPARAKKRRDDADGEPCECPCAPCEAGDCADCDHEDCDCVGCTCPTAEEMLSSRAIGLRARIHVNAGK